MSKVLVLYHSTYGHIEAMAQAEAEGARSGPGERSEAFGPGNLQGVGRSIAGRVARAGTENDLGAAARDDAVAIGGELDLRCGPGAHADPRLGDERR